MRWLGSAEVLLIAAEVLGCRPEDLAEQVDLAALEAALGASRTPEPSGPEEAAARLFRALAGPAVIAGAGRRVAWLAACQLLSLNDVELADADPVALRSLLSDVAGGKREPHDLAAWIISARRRKPTRRIRPGQLLAVRPGHDPVAGQTRRLRMFERFTSEARTVVAEAREQARLLNHDFIGTEHVLLGLLAHGQGTAVRALSSFGVTHEAARMRVRELIGAAGGAVDPDMNAPFTPRTKKVLELSLREAVKLGDRHIGTEHILLGLIREGEGVAATVLQDMDVSLEELRRCVSRLRAGTNTVDEAETGQVAGRLHADIDSLVQRNGLLEAEVRRLRSLLEERGIDPDPGALSA